MPATYEPIATTTLSSAQTQVTFSSIPSTYTDLVLISNASISGYVASMYLRFNSDSGSNYNNTRMYGDGSSAQSDRPSTPQTELGFAIAGSEATPKTVAVTNIQNYANTIPTKSVISRGNWFGNYVSIYAGLWNSTAAINRIDIYFRLVGSDTAVSGSTFTLYGIKAA
jgi:hypothetical protein